MKASLRFGSKALYSGSIQGLAGSSAQLSYYASLMRTLDLKRVKRVTAADVKRLAGRSYCRWTKILHHFETMGSHCILVVTGESSFQEFLGGAGFRPSTVGFHPNKCLAIVSIRHSGGSGKKRVRPGQWTRHEAAAPIFGSPERHGGGEVLCLVPGHLRFLGV